MRQATIWEATSQVATSAHHKASKKKKLSTLKRPNVLHNIPAPSKLHNRVAPLSTTPASAKKNEKKLATQQHTIIAVISNKINTWVQSDVTFRKKPENHFTKEEFSA